MALVMKWVMALVITLSYEMGTITLLGYEMGKMAITLLMKWVRYGR